MFIPAKNFLHSPGRPHTTWLRRQLTDLPVRDDLESACFGWLGERLPLRAGHRQNAQVLGQIQPGDTISYSHLSEGGWTYVTTSTGDWQVKSA